MRIGFIGLGNMGGGMAANLVKAGHAVRACDLAPAALERARGHGCETFATIRDAVAGADAVVTMLPNGEIVDRVYRGDIIGHAPTGALLIDCSTIDVATARSVAATAASAGYDMVDAPVSGGIAAAGAGTLTFMVGGSDEAFTQAQPLLAVMGKAVIHAGDSSAGQAAKACNNMLLAIHMIGTCEAFTMAQRLGLDAHIFYDIAAVSTGQCWSVTSYCPLPGVGPQSPADNGYQGGFATTLMLKDLKLAMDAAQTSGSIVPMGRHAAALYDDFAAAGNGGLDFSAIIRTVQTEN